jgi:putative transposase
MPQYRRFQHPGATWFFTVNLAERRGNRLLLDRIDALRTAFSDVKFKRPFTIDAIVILPDHLHCIWTLPEGDSDFPRAGDLSRRTFPDKLPKANGFPKAGTSAASVASGNGDFGNILSGMKRIIDYTSIISWNPVKHGWVQCVKDWPHSSFHRYVDSGVYIEDWGVGTESLKLRAGE